MSEDDKIKLNAILREVEKLKERTNDIRLAEALGWFYTDMITIETDSYLEKIK